MFSINPSLINKMITIIKFTLLNDKVLRPLRYLLLQLLHLKIDNSLDHWHLTKDRLRYRRRDITIFQLSLFNLKILRLSVRSFRILVLSKTIRCVFLIIQDCANCVGFFFIFWNFLFFLGFLFFFLEFFLQLFFLQRFLFVFLFCFFCRFDCFLR